MKFEIPEIKKKVHEMIIPIRWGDMDAMGHVNNTVYFRYLETVRIDYFQSIGCEPNPQGQGPVIVNAFCNFIKPVKYPADLIIKTYITNPTRVGLDTFNEMSLASDPETVRATSGATIVWVDFKSQKAASWPDQIKAKLVL